MMKKTMMWTVSGAVFAVTVWGPVVIGSMMAYGW